jgi:hypothetical protein
MNNSIESCGNGGSRTGRKSDIASSGRSISFVHCLVHLFHTGQADEPLAMQKYHQG